MTKNGALLPSLSHVNKKTAKKEEEEEGDGGVDDAQDDK